MTLEEKLHYPIRVELSDDGKVKVSQATRECIDKWSTVYVQEGGSTDLNNHVPFDVFDLLGAVGRSVLTV
ncbi:MAG: hypothetical protein COA78_20485 [Blastopirellula sp.]|nr:MAG: hypothetical protein COA78_20485 [Blastopirellula sp.]